MAAQNPRAREQYFLTHRAHTAANNLQGQEGHRVYKYMRIYLYTPLMPGALWWGVFWLAGARFLTG